MYKCAVGNIPGNPTSGAMNNNNMENFRFGDVSYGNLSNNVYFYLSFNQQSEYKVFYKLMCWLAGWLAGWLTGWLGV